MIQTEHIGLNMNDLEDNELVLNEFEKVCDMIKRGSGTYEEMDSLYSKKKTLRDWILIRMKEEV